MAHFFLRLWGAELHLFTRPTSRTILESMKRHTLFLSIAILFLALTPAAFAEDWFPEIINKEFNVADAQLASYFTLNATYVSGNENFQLYYLANVEKNYSKESFTLKPAQDTNTYYTENQAQFMIINYNSQWFYYEFSFCSSYINFNILNLDYSPVIELKYMNRNLDEARAVVFFNGKGFSIRSSESNCNYTESPETRRFFTSYYTLQGKSYQITGTMVPSIEREVSTDTIINFNDYETFSGTVNDNRVRLRTSNSLNSGSIRYLNNGDTVTFILLDPTPAVIGGTIGYWMLVRTNRSETRNQDIGWIWSPYISGISFGYSEK